MGYCIDAVIFLLVEWHKLNVGTIFEQEKKTVIVDNNKHESKACDNVRQITP